MAGRYLNNRNAQELLNSRKGEIEDVIRQLKASDDPEDRFVLEAMLFGNDTSRIGGLDDFYRIVPSAKPERDSKGEVKRVQEQEREDIRKLAINGDIENKITVDGKEYIIEDYLRNPSLINNGGIPAEVLREKQRLYPEGINLVKIPKGENRSESTLLALAMNEIEDRDIVDRTIGPNLAPSMDLSYESRKMDEDLENALESQFLLDKRSPLHNLRYAGMHKESKKRRAETGDAFSEIQSVMIGDMVRRVNPVTNTRYGSPYMENGVLVRDQVDGGHVYDHKIYQDLAHKPWNIIAEPGQENKVKQSRAKGQVFTDKHALFNNINTALNEGNDLSNLKNGLLAVASERPELEDRVLTLLDKIATVQQMPAQGRGSRQALQRNNWSTL